MKMFLLVGFFIYSPIHSYGDLRGDLQKEARKGHKAFSYRQARRFLFGNLHLWESKRKGYVLETYYCGKEFSKKSLKSMGRDRIPSSNIVNTEHVWPQSRFVGGKERRFQKTDLHHLFPVLSPINSRRANHLFGDVSHSVKEVCDGAFSGLGKSGHKVFEPRDEVKGDVARAVFYFSVRYGAKLADYSEKVLKKWNQLDPVDDWEKERNDLIEGFQGNRNPFVDDPSLVSKIKNY